MDHAKEQGHEVKTCIVVRHLQRLNAYFESNEKAQNGVNGDSGNHYEVIIDNKWQALRVEMKFSLLNSMVL